MGISRFNPHSRSQCELDRTNRASRLRQCWPSVRSCPTMKVHNWDRQDRPYWVHAKHDVPLTGPSRQLHIRRTGRSLSIAGSLCKLGSGINHLRKLDTIRRRLVVRSSINNQRGNAVMTLLPRTTNRIFLAAGFFFLPPASPPMNPIAFSNVTSKTTEPSSSFLVVPLAPFLARV